ncbi:MAG: hypothetical protein IAE79_01625 [Anaerolinea sp.]|nr:hypothetical protein [Anaerolinea sp.]
MTNKKQVSIPFFLSVLLALALLLLALALLPGALEGLQYARNFMSVAPGPVVVVTAAPQASVNQAADMAVTIQPTVTAVFATLSPGLLADCALGQAQGQPVSPRCPENAAEMLGQGR